MDINKLNIKPQDIDRNTGRIILPGSEELERIKLGMKKPGVERAKEELGVDKEASKNKVIVPVAMTDESQSNSNIDSLYSVPPIEDTYKNSGGLLLTPMMLGGLCVLFITLLMGVVSALLFHENTRLEQRFDNLSRRLENAEQKNNEILMVSLREKAMLKNEVASLRGRVSAVNGLLGSASDEILNTSELKGDDEAVNFIYKDDEGNVIPEEEIISGVYVLQE